MFKEIPKFVVPGQYITSCLKIFSIEPKIIQKFESSNGSIIQKINLNNENQLIISSTLIGNVNIEEINEEINKEINKDNIIIKRYKISVNSLNSNSYKEYNLKIDNLFAINLPKEGDIVLTRITKLSLKQANVEILAVEGSGNVLIDSNIDTNSNLNSIHLTTSDLIDTFKGIIRSQDIRSTERDKVIIIDSFKPGDIVRAQVLSLGDGSNYYLTTARNDLGVIFAKAKNGIGGLMFPIDWKTMICNKTGEIELRKCANPFLNK